MSFLEVTAQLANGFVTTLLIFGVTLVGAIPLGLLITLGSMSKIPPVKWIFKIFVWIILRNAAYASDNPGVLRAGSDGAGCEVRQTFGGYPRVHYQLRLLFFGDLPRRYREHSEGAVRGGSGAWHDQGADFFQGSAVSGHKENSSADGPTR